MLRVNNTDHPYRDGMTIKALMEEKGFVFHRIIVKHSGKILEDADYASTFIKDGYVIEMFHILIGG